MLELIKEILSPEIDKPANLTIPTVPNTVYRQGLIGYYLDNGQKNLALTKNYAIKSTVIGLEVVVAEPTVSYIHDGGCVLVIEEYQVFLTQHEGKDSTIDRAVKRIMAYKDFFDCKKYPVPTPSIEANLRRVVVDFKIQGTYFSTDELYDDYES